MSAQEDRRATLERQRQVIEGAIAETQAELTALEKVLANPDAVLMYEDHWYVVDRAAVELAVRIFPLYQLASPEARRSLEARIPTLVPALIAVGTAVEESAESLPELLKMEEQDRWNRIRSRISPSLIFFLWSNPVKAGGDDLRAELSDLQGLLAAIDEELEGLRSLQPDPVDVGPEALAAGDSPDDTPVVDEPKRIPRTPRRKGRVLVAVGPRGPGTG